MSLLIKRGNFRGQCGSKVDTSKPIEIFFWDNSDKAFVARVICIDRESPDGNSGVALFKVTGSAFQAEQVVFFNPENGEGWAPLTSSDAIVRTVRET